MVEEISNTESVYEVYYDRSINAVIMEWNGYARSEEFRAGTELMLATMKENNTTKVLGNITDFTLIGQSDQHWLIYNLLPRAIDYGFNKCALTIPRFYFNKVAVENVIAQISGNQLKTKLFEHLEEGRNWISDNEK